MSQGESWLQHVNTLHVCEDASSVGDSAYMPAGKMAHQMQISFDANEVELMSQNKLSSVYRETRNARLAVQSVVYSLKPSQLAGAVVVYTGDCLPSIQGLQKMGGTPTVFPEIKQLFLFAAHHDVHVDFV